MRRLFPLFAIALTLRCTGPAPPPPEAAPEPVRAEPAPAALAAEEKVVGTVRVTASALNVRREASTDADAVTQVRRGTLLDVLGEDESWVNVRLASGETGWVAARFVSKGSTRDANGRAEIDAGPGRLSARFRLCVRRDAHALVFRQRRAWRGRR